MHTYIYRGPLIIICASLTTFSFATPIYKCTTAQGAIIFSDTACPSDAQREIYQLNAPMTIPALSQSSIQQSLTKQPRQQTRVTVISDDDSPCGTVDPTERRTQLVRKQVASGMSQAEVESMYGKPLSQRRHNGTTHATYRGSGNQTLSVRFNEHGCVP